MGKITGFLEYKRETPQTKTPSERIKNHNEFYIQLDEGKLNKQAARCMDCGIPFCHSGCPLGNNIPEFNDKVYLKDWNGAYDVLTSTNNFPEFTGRICPSPCEVACVLALEGAPTTIENIEKTIVEKAFESGYVKPQPPNFRTGKRVAVVGSGPAGLATAAQLNKAGHWVVVFERANKIGGLLRYGIPDFKLEKNIIDRRIKIMQDEGIAFRTKTNVGGNYSSEQLLSEFDAIVLAGGSTVPRDLNIPGRNLKGVHFAMGFLTQQNKRNSGEKFYEEEILATNKNVVVIGGGDTGADCVGTSIRQNAKSVTQIELLAKPPLERTTDNPWPLWSNILRTSTSHQEGCERMWSVLTKEFIGDENACRTDWQGNLTGIKITDIKWENKNHKSNFVEIEGTERIINCDLVLLAMGFVHPQHDGLINEIGVEKDERGNVKSRKFKTITGKVFTAGDMHRGQSLVTWAISEGREAAREVDKYLMGYSFLESKDGSLLDVV